MPWLNGYCQAILPSDVDNPCHVQLDFSVKATDLQKSARVILNMQRSVEKVEIFTQKSGAIWA
jgi:hypothetical protein